MLDLVPGGAEPRIARPPEIVSSVVTCLASIAGLRYVTPVTSVPSRTRVGLAGEGGEHRPALEHRLVRSADAVDLVEVVHDRDEVEAGRLGRLGLLDDAVEQPLRRGIGVGVGGEVETEPDAHRNSLDRCPQNAPPIGRSARAGPVAGT